MASLHSHRKILAENSPDSNFTITEDDDPTVQTCLYFCDTQRNYTLPNAGFCPQACLAICPTSCHYSLSDLPFTPDFNPSKPNKSHNLSPLLICMLILLATTFLLITLYVIYTKLCYSFYAPNSNSSLQTRTRRRRRRRREGAGSYSLDEDHRRRMVFHPFWYIPTVGLPPTAISSIPVQRYDKEVEERDCAVCLTEFEEGDELRVLPKCNHAFHIPCIDTWLSSHTTCPLCRVPIIPPDHGNHDQDHNHHHKDDDTSSSLTSVEGATEGNSPTEVLRVSVISGEEEARVANTIEETIENTPDKDQGNSGRANEGSCSQTWSLERGAANLLSRSLSCSGKIFSSRSNIRPSPNS